MARYPWSVLGIEKTSDERAIKSAYAGKLKTTRPEDDAVAFQRLVEARDTALTIARRPRSSGRNKDAHEKRNGAKRGSPDRNNVASPRRESDNLSRPQKPTAIQTPVQHAAHDDPEPFNDRLAADVCNFLEPSADTSDEAAASSAIDELAAGSIAQKAAVETTILHHVVGWLERQRQALEDGASHNSGMDLYNLQKLAVVRLDMQYGWSEDIRRLSTLIPFARKISDELDFVRNGTRIDQQNTQAMPVWMKFIGVLSITMGSFYILVYGVGWSFWKIYMFLVQLR